MSSQVFSILAWNIVPNLATNILQNIYYGFTIPAGEPKPQQGHPRFIRDRRYIYILVISVYFFYSLYEVDWELKRKSNFYLDLGLPFSAEDKAVQSRFRRLTVHLHPDKLTGLAPEQFAKAQTYYIHLKSAKDTLADSVKRFAYERFGPEVLEWKNCVTRFEYLKFGFGQMIVYYIVAYVGILVAGFLGYTEHMRYWQLFVTTALFVFETHTISQPRFPLLATAVINPIRSIFKLPGYLPFETIIVFRRTIVSGFLAAAHLSPLFRQEAALTDGPEDQQKAMHQLASVIQEVDSDAQRMLNLEASPFVGDEERETRLKDALVSWLVQNEVRNSGEVQNAIRRVVRKRNDEAEDAEQE